MGHMYGEQAAGTAMMEPKGGSGEQPKQSVLV